MKSFKKNVMESFLTKSNQYNYYKNNAQKLEKEKNKLVSEKNELIKKNETLKRQNIELNEKISKFSKKNTV